MRPLQQGNTAEDYSIQKDSTLHIVARNRLILFVGRPLLDRKSTFATLRELPRLHRRQNHQISRKLGLVGRTDRMNGVQNEYRDQKIIVLPERLVALLLCSC
jgi:hypothetical protein